MRDTKAYKGRRDIDPFILNLTSRCGWVVSFLPWPLYPWQRTPVPIKQEDGWTPESVWAFYRKEKSIYTAGVWTPCRPHSHAITVSTKPTNFWKSVKILLNHEVTWSITYHPPLSPVNAQKQQSCCLIFGPTKENELEIRIYRRLSRRSSVGTMWTDWS